VKRKRMVSVSAHHMNACVVCQERKAFVHTAASMLAGLSSLGSEEEGENEDNM
jgi:hypothetical protein